MIEIKFQIVAVASCKTREVLYKILDSRRAMLANSTRDAITSSKIKQVLLLIMFHLQNTKQIPCSCRDVRCALVKIE